MPQKPPSETPSQSPRIVVLDFDGTVTLNDIGDGICDRFADPSWKDIDRLWEQDKLSLDDAQRLMWAKISATKSEIDRFLPEIGAFREGFEGFITWCKAENTPVVLASGGFDYYIQALLGPLVNDFSAIYCNQLGFSKENGITVDFPHKNTLGCPRCPVCKGRICAQYSDKAQVIFIGDGTSDRCAIGQAHQLFVVRGSKLHKASEAAKARAHPFDSFWEIRDRLHKSGRPRGTGS